jgi:hypothetical protein
MSESLQFGHHPDADEISAFVEQALPAHEREAVLGHLAMCAECRAMVALSLPEVEAPAQTVSVPARKPWWLGWNLALPVAGAIAAAALAFVYLYPSNITSVTREPEVAVARPTQPLAASKQPPAPAAQQAVQDFKKAPEKGRSALGGVATVAPRQNSNAFRSGQSVGGPILAGRDVVALQSQAVAPPIRGEGGSAVAAKAADSPSPGVGGAIAGIAKAPANIPGAPPREPAPSLPATSADQVMQATPATAPAASAAETVSVTNGAPINTVSAVTANPEIAVDEIQGTQSKHPLPSRLAVLSSAVLGRRIVAIDTEHNVFASDDGGKQWKSVSTPWQGHAARVNLVQRTGGVALGSLSGFSAGSASPSDSDLALKTSAAAIAQTPPPSSPTGSSLNGAVTDRTGAVIADATVTAVEIATGAAHTVRSDASGHYAIDGLSPGNYRVEGQSAGFEKREIASVAIQPTGPATENLILDVGQSTQTVTVEGDKAEVSASQKKQTKSKTQSATGPVFEIVTESGESWTSADGLSWQHN